MKKHLLLICFVVFIAGCKKDSTQKRQSECYDEIVSTDINGNLIGNNSYKIYYDNYGKVSREYADYNDYAYEVLYEYGNNTITITDIIVKSEDPSELNKSSKRIYTLENNLIVKASDIDNSRPYYFKYDTKNRLIEADLTSINKSYKSKIEWGDSNIIKADSYNFEYYSSLNNNILLNPLYIAYGDILEDAGLIGLIQQGYYGIHSVNTVSKMYNDYNITEFSINHGTISKRRINSLGTSLTYNKFISNECR